MKHDGTFNWWENAIGTFATPAECQGEQPQLTLRLEDTLYANDWDLDLVILQVNTPVHRCGACDRGTADSRIRPMPTSFTARLHSCWSDRL